MTHFKFPTTRTFLRTRKKWENNICRSNGELWPLLLVPHPHEERRHRKGNFNVLKVPLFRSDEIFDFSNQNPKPVSSLFILGFNLWNLVPETFLMVWSSPLRRSKFPATVSIDTNQMFGSLQWNNLINSMATEIFFSICCNFFNRPYLCGRSDTESRLRNFTLSVEWFFAEKKIHDPS